MRKKPTLLLVDDSRALRGALSRLMETKGYLVVEAGTADQALRKARRERPDLVLCDWVLGKGMTGVTVCSRLKSRPETRSIPIVVMTGAKVEFSDELSALRHGADLYLTKGEIFGSTAKSRRFFAYLRCLLSRPSRLGPGKDSSEGRPGIEIDLDGHTVRTPSETVADLPTKLFDLLYLLARRYPGVASREQLLRALWKCRVRRREVDVAISRLKARIERGKAELVESVHGKGYRLRVSASILSRSRARREGGATPVANGFKNRAVSEGNALPALTGVRQRL